MTISKLRKCAYTAVIAERKSRISNNAAKVSDGPN